MEVLCNVTWKSVDGMTEDGKDIIVTHTCDKPVDGHARHVCYRCGEIKK